MKNKFTKKYIIITTLIKMELDILNLVSIQVCDSFVLRNEKLDIQYRYMRDIPNIYDIIVIKKAELEICKPWYINYRDYASEHYETFSLTDVNLCVYVNRTYTRMLTICNEESEHVFLCNYDKSDNDYHFRHIIAKTNGDAMYENIDKMQQYLPLKIITLMNESDIKILKQFFNITMINSIKVNDTDINLYLFTKRETLTKAAIRKS